MLVLLKNILFACLLLGNLSFLQGELHTEKDFMLLTIPKSGTHLTGKLLTMLTGRSGNALLLLDAGFDSFRFTNDLPNRFVSYNTFLQRITDLHARGQYMVAHFNYSPFATTYLEKDNPECVTFIQIRDLRDACVSCVYMCKNEIAKEIGTDDFDAQLMYVIKMRHSVPRYCILNIHRNAEIAVSWYQKANTIVCRFEDLVGPEGGGSREAQEAQIFKIAEALSISLNDAELETICSNLFGAERGPFNFTFRQGQIGSWKKHFKKEHRLAFKKHMGSLQTALGYE
jgi:hypothetical protein